jgi:hypothetical protein
VNAKEITTSIVMVSKVTTVVHLFRATFPKLRTDLAPWQQDAYMNPRSVDIGFHFPGRHPACQCRSILVQIYVSYDAQQHPQAVEKIELAGYDHQGQCWWFSTAGYWQFMGDFIPELDQRDELRRLCCQMFNLFVDEQVVTTSNMGLSEAELFTHFGFAPQMIAVAAQQANLTVVDYLQHLTGWVLLQDRYYPIQQSQDDIA